MTREKFLELFPNASATTLARNGFAPVGAVVPAERQRDPPSPLDSQLQGRPKSKKGVGYCIAIIACSPRKIDGDNLVSGCKPLRDAIATTLGIDDGDDRLDWQYSQVQSSGGTNGTIVKIEQI